MMEEGDNKPIDQKRAVRYINTTFADGGGGK